MIPTPCHLIKRFIRVIKRHIVEEKDKNTKLTSGQVVSTSVETGHPKNHCWLGRPSISTSENDQWGWGQETLEESELECWVCSPVLRFRVTPQNGCCLLPLGQGCGGRRLVTSSLTMNF